MKIQGIGLNCLSGFALWTHLSIGSTFYPSWMLSLLKPFGTAACVAKAVYGRAIAFPVADCFRSALCVSTEDPNKSFSSVTFSQARHLSAKFTLFNKYQGGLSFILRGCTTQVRPRPWFKNTRFSHTTAFTTPNYS